MPNHTSEAGHRHERMCRELAILCVCLGETGRCAGNVTMTQIGCGDGLDPQPLWHGACPRCGQEYKLQAGSI